MARFEWLELRTTDVAAARAFYEGVLDGPAPAVVPLPAEAAARGAPAHWLGHVGVDDPEGTARALEALGAARLGRPWTTPWGGWALGLRDPGGAVLALATPPPPPVPASPEVRWHQLHAADLTRAAAAYQAALGWALTAPLDLGPFGVHQGFAWAEGGPEVGSMVHTAELAGVHPHWLFHLAVPALAPALAAVRAGGGQVIGPFQLAGGEQVAVCEDPQGAAFALRSAPQASQP